MQLQKQYEWLQDEPGPKMLLEFLKLYGVHETPGPGDNPVIMEWAREVGLSHEYTADSVPWCALFMAIIAKRAGKEIPVNPLWALNWANFGTKVSDGAKLGDVLVFKRDGGGHVTLYIGEDGDCYHCGGGNQSDMVDITRKPKDRIYVIRRPIYQVQPVNVRSIYLSSDGAIDNRES